MKMEKKHLIKWILIAVAAAAVLGVLIFLLRNVGAGKKPERPITALSAVEISSAGGKEGASTSYIKLLGNMNLSKTIVIEKGNHVILDLNGHTVKSKKGIQAFSVTTGASLTLQNGTVLTAGADANGGVLSVNGAGCGLNLENVILTNTDDSQVNGTVSGGVLYVSSPVENADAPAVVNISGTTVITGSPSGIRRNGGAIYAEGAARIHMYGGTIQNGVAGCAGNVQLIDQAQFYMHDGLISGGVANGKTKTSGLGGNVDIRGKARFCLYGGTVIGGKAEENGGNFFVSNFGTASGEDSLHIYGGKVSGGVATSGGNIYALDKDSVIRMHGGSVELGDAVSGGNICLESAGFVMRGGALGGLQQSQQIVYGGNVFANNSQIALYDGYVINGKAEGSGGNFYISDTAMDIYGGTVMAGASNATEVNAGGGNLFAAGESTVNMYGGEISQGVSNLSQAMDASAAGGNVIIAGKTKMQLFGGTIKEGMVYGNICRGGSVYVYGQQSSSYCVFHMYGGKVENGPLTNTMRGMCIGAYNQSNGTGLGIARIFNGTINYLGAHNDPNRYNAVYSNGNSIQVYDESAYSGLLRGVRRGPCEDATHCTQVETKDATCITPCYTKYSCETCGDWYELAGSPTGHFGLEGEAVELDGQAGWIKFHCDHCGDWYRSEAQLQEQNENALEANTVPEPMAIPDYSLQADATTDQLRQTAVQAMRDLLSVQWCSKEGFGYNKDGSKKYFEYPAQMTFGGVNYSGAGAGLFHFLEYYNPTNGQFSYPGTADEMKMKVGSACTDSLLWSWSTVCNSYACAYAPNEMVPNNGFVPVGDYTFNENISSFAMLSTETIVEDNGAQVMAAAYAQMLPADILVSSTDIHGMMAIEKPFVLNAPDGSIDLKASYVMIQDQRGGVGAGFYEVEHENYTVHHSGRISQQFTFEELLEKNYIPVTAKEFVGQDPYEVPEISVSGSCTTLEELLNVTVSSNYPLVAVNINALDAKGNGVILDKVLFNGLSSEGVPTSYFLGDSEVLKSLNKTAYAKIMIEVVTSTGLRSTPIELKLS